MERGSDSPARTFSPTRARSHTPSAGTNPGFPACGRFHRSRREGARLTERLPNEFQRRQPSPSLHPVEDLESLSLSQRVQARPEPSPSYCARIVSADPPHSRRVVASAPPPLAGCSRALARSLASVSRCRRRVCLTAQLAGRRHARGTRRKEQPATQRSRTPTAARPAPPGSSARRRPACIRARGGSARPCCSGTPPACAAHSCPARAERSPRRCLDPSPRPRNCRRRPRAPRGRVPEQVRGSVE